MRFLRWIIIILREKNRIDIFIRLLADKKKKKDKGEKTHSVAEAQQATDFLIPPQKATPALDTSQWPLLLKVCHCAAAPLILCQLANYVCRITTSSMCARDISPPSLPDFRL